MSTAQFWRRCSGCKTEIGFEQTYWVCSVSTCNRPRTGMFFCSVSCWEAHLPMMRHREAYAVEKRSPTAAEWQREQAASSAETTPRPQPSTAQRSSHSTPRPSTATRKPPEPARRIVAPTREEEDLPRDILIVASKLKKYIKARSGMNTSEAVMQVLSDHVRKLCDQAIRSAGENERKTVLDRDFPPVR